MCTEFTQPWFLDGRASTLVTKDNFPGKLNRIPVQYLVFKTIYHLYKTYFKKVQQN